MAKKYAASWRRPLAPHRLANTLWRTTDVYVINPVSIGDRTVKTLFAVAALLALAMPAGVTETSFFSDASGRSMGLADRFGDITFYNDAQGRPIGSSTPFGNQTFYDAPPAARLDRRPPSAATNERRRAPAADAAGVGFKALAVAVQGHGRRHAGPAVDRGRRS